MDPLALLAGVLGTAGFVLGLAADRFATRWPEHDEEHPPGRPVDWRTAVAALVGALALGLLPLRFGGDPLAFALFVGLGEGECATGPNTDAIAIVRHLIDQLPCNFGEFGAGATEARDDDSGSAVPARQSRRRGRRGRPR